MSRSALSRQEGNVRERERQAEELFQLAVDEGKSNRSKNLLLLWGPEDSFHFNPMLLNNIKKSQYFQKCCRDIHDWNALVDEIYYQVKSLEPWAVGTYLNFEIVGRPIVVASMPSSDPVHFH
jgi:pre-mRNA-splicing factor 38B